MRGKFLPWWMALLAGFAASAWADSTTVHAVSVDDKLLPYEKSATGVSGNLSSVGSDTLANLMTLWAEAFKRRYPGVHIQVQAAGSSTAPPALIAGGSNLAPMSRLMKKRELEAFKSKYGYKPTPIRVAIDAVAVYTHKDNPLEKLTLPQLDAIFSSTRKCGYGEDITVWGQLNLTGEWSGRAFQLYGRNSVSGTYGFFKKKALCRGDYKNTVNEEPGSSSVVRAVSTSLNGIGYSGIGYKTSGVKVIPLALDENHEYFEASHDNTIRGTYPLARFLYLYVNKPLGESLRPLEREFIKLVLSRDGQTIVIKDGYVPLPAFAVEEELAKLNAP